MEVVEDEGVAGALVSGGELAGKKSGKGETQRLL
jgi:hypothetical protein